VSICITAGALISLYVSRSITLSILMMAVSGMATSGRTTVGYVFINEFLTPSWQVAFGTAFNFVDGATGLIITLYFDFVSKHYIYIASVGLILTGISIITVFLFANESPLWQLKKGKIQAA
jgi:hypothetical protein